MRATLILSLAAAFFSCASISVIGMAAAAVARIESSRKRRRVKVDMGYALLCKCTATHQSYLNASALAIITNSANDDARGSHIPVSCDHFTTEHSPFESCC